MKLDIILAAAIGVGLILVAPADAQKSRGTAQKPKCAYCGWANVAGAKICDGCKCGLDYAKYPVPKILTNTNETDINPSWGPSGKIAYTSTKGGRNVWVMNGDGSNPVGHPRGQDSLGDITPDWGPNDKIVFAGGVSHLDLWIMDPDGSNRKKITDYDGDERMPSMNAEGKIAFASDFGRPSATEHSNIFVIDMDGGNRVQLTKPGSYAYNPCWSPDGKQIAFNMAVNENHDVYVMDADGSNLKRLTTHAAADYDPSWGPDGKIAFVSERD